MTLQRMCVESNGDFTDPQVPLRQYAVLCVGRASSVMTTSAIGTTGLCWGQSAGQHGLSESGIPSTSQYPSSTICSSSSSSRTQATYRVSTPVSPHVDEHWTDNNHILVTGRSTSCHMGVHTAEPRTENRAWHTDIHTYIHTYIRTHELISANSTCSICCGLVLELAEKKIHNKSNTRSRGFSAHLSKHDSLYRRWARCGYLPSHTASPSVKRYQIIQLGDRVKTTCPEYSRSRESNPGPVHHMSDAPARHPSNTTGKLINPFLPRVPKCGQWLRDSMPGWLTDHY